MKKILLSVMAIALLICFSTWAGNVSIINYAVTSGSTTAYVQAIASTPITVSQMYVCDTSGQVIKIASGASGSEVDLFTAPVSGCAIFPVNPYLVSGSRISIKSGGTSSVSSGYNSISLLP